MNSVASWVLNVSVPSTSVVTSGMAECLVDSLGLMSDNGNELTEEQRRKIEQNRLDALERLRKRQERMSREQLSSSTDVQPVVTPIANDKGKVGISKTTQVVPDPTISRINTKIVLQLDSQDSFSTPSCAALGGIYRSISGAKYVIEENLWKFPLNQYQTLLNKLGPNRPSQEDQIPNSILKIFSLPPPSFRTFNLQCIDAGLLSSLYPFQREGVEMVLNRDGRIILADDMGLGKSIQALAIVSYYRSEWPLLIITPASMVASWYEQLKKWIPSVPTDRIIVAYDSKTGLTGLVNITSYDLAVKLVPMSEVQFQVIIADECHALKNTESKRSKTLIPFLKSAGRAILLSGTPAMSRPMELYPQIQAVQPTLFPKFFDFGKRYCNGQQGYFGWDFKGASNLRELQLVLERTVMIRRTKDSVLSQLPRKLRHQIFLKISEKELNTFKKLSEFRSIPHEVDDQALEHFQKKAEYMALWKRTAEIKLPAMLEYIVDLLEAGHKMLIFAHHQTVLDSVEDHIVAKTVRSIRIDGKTSPSTRQELCNAFQTELSIRVAILSITAASIGLTLTAATTVIFAELFWNPGVLVQAEDRAHRIGQSDSVNVHYLLARGTTDDSIWPLILKKLSLLESVGLGKNDFDSVNRQDHDPNQMKLDKFFNKTATRKRTLED